MKRRNVDCAKPRRTIRRPKIDGFSTASINIHLKFFIVWALVILSDYMFEFRFEYLWPFWLLLRSVYDSFRYQGLAFSVLFLCMALTSDIICLLFVPINWLFFIASSYVWVQFIWHTDKGFCMPTVVLWALFIYVEGIVRLKDMRHLPFHLDLCRPFAAHCIGYPVVTLGFGLKSYVGYRLRQRRQREIAKENKAYFQLLEEALPPELRSNYKREPRSESCNGAAVKDGLVNTNNVAVDKRKDAKIDYKNESPSPPKAKVPTGSISAELEYMQQKTWCSSKSVNDFDESNADKDKISKNREATESSSSTIDADKKKSNNSSQLNGTAKFPGSHANNLRESAASKDRKNKNKDNNNKDISSKDDAVSIIRLESDIKRLKADLQASRQTEQELRNQINTFLSNEQVKHDELHQLHQDNDNLQNKLHNLVTARQGDRSNINQLEKRIADEKKGRLAAESHVSQLEKKTKKLEEQNLNKERALNTAKLECSESCRIRRNELESELRRIRREQRASEDRTRNLERELNTLRAAKENQSETDVLMSALSAMQDKTAHLETSLSAETKIKLDLFSALGEAKRKIEMNQSVIASKDKEIEELKNKIAEIMAVCPQPSFQSNSADTTRFRFSPKSPVQGQNQGSTLMPDLLETGFDSLVGMSFSSPPPPLSPLSTPLSSHSTLDPNARVYTPKGAECHRFD